MVKICEGQSKKVQHMSNKVSEEEKGKNEEGGDNQKYKEDPNPQIQRAES